MCLSLPSEAAWAYLEEANPPSPAAQQVATTAELAFFAAPSPARQNMERAVGSLPNPRFSGSERLESQVYSAQSEIQG
jgi:hypothetical protein